MPLVSISGFVVLCTKMLTHIVLEQDIAEVQ